MFGLSYEVVVTVRVTKRTCWVLQDDCRSLERDRAALSRIPPFRIAHKAARATAHLLSRLHCRPRLCKTMLAVASAQNPFSLSTGGKDGGVHKLLKLERIEFEEGTQSAVLAVPEGRYQPINDMPEASTSKVGHRCGCLGRGAVANCGAH